MRSFIKFQSKFPLLIPLIFLSLGQYCQAVFINFWLYIALASITALLMRGSLVLLFMICLLTGSLSFLNNSPAGPTLLLSNSKTYFVRVSDRPRYRRVGEVELLFDILELKSIDDFKYKVSGQKVLCKGKDLPWENDSELKQGDYAFIKARFREVGFSYNPFSFQQKLIRNSVTHECKLTYVSKPARFEGFVRKTRDSLFTKIKSILGDGERSGLFLSMALGEQDILSEETERAFKETGMAHLLVVSGYQISIVYFSVVSLLVLLLGQLKNVYMYMHVLKTASVCGFILACFYSLIVGFESSVLRALTATLVYIICNLLERRKSFANSMLVSLLILQIIYPLSIFEPGVELTFAALIGMSLAGEVGSIRAYLLSSVYASFATSLVSYFWFGTFSLIGVILNPIFATMISIISCNFGFLAILLLLTRIDSGGVLLGCVADCLVYFRDFVLVIS